MQIYEKAFHDLIFKRISAIHILYVYRPIYHVLFYFLNVNCAFIYVSNFASAHLLTVPSNRLTARHKVYTNFLQGFPARWTLLCTSINGTEQ